jgi:hypothetical protein
MTMHDTPNLPAVTDGSLAVAPLGERMRYAQALADARLLPGPYRRSPADVLLAVDMAAALGIAPVQALTSIHVIDGKPSMSAELMRALVLRAGHRIRVVESTAQRCVLEVARREAPDERSTFVWTTDDAHRAGLLPAKDGSNWARHPAAMLLARCSSTACRAVFPDVLAGVSYTPDELGATVADDGAVVVGEVVRTDDGPDDAAPADEGTDAEPDSIAGVPRPGTGRRGDGIGRSTMDSVRHALGTPQRGDGRGPTDAQMRATWAKLRAAGARDETHARWTLAVLLDLPDYPEHLRDLDRAQVSRVLDMADDAVADAVAATADMPHPDDVDDGTADAVVVDDGDAQQAAEDSPPQRPRLSSDGDA